MKVALTYMDIVRVRRAQQAKSELLGTLARLIAVGVNIGCWVIILWGISTIV